MSKKIHFIGMGNMGLPMAINLSQSFDIGVFDLNPDACQQAQKAGLTVLSSDEVGVGSEVLFTMLPAGEHVYQAVIKNDIAKKTAKNALIIDCSTTDQRTALLLKEYADNNAVRALDAPVSGGTKGAKEHTLTFMVGGSSDSFETAKPYLAAMGKNIFHVGKNGLGQAAKICNNMLLGIIMLGTSEALNLAYALGVEPKIMSDIMHKSSGTNWVLDIYNPWPQVMPTAPASHGYKGGFKSGLIHKDLKLAENEAINHNTSIYLGTLARNLFSAHCQQGNEDKDFSSVLNMYRDLSSLAEEKKN